MENIDTFFNLYLLISAVIILPIIAIICETPTPKPLPKTTERTALTRKQETLRNLAL